MCASLIFLLVIGTAWSSFHNSSHTKKMKNLHTLQLAFYTQTRHKQIRSHAYCTFLIACDIKSDLIWLRYHGHLAESWYGNTYMYSNCTILVCFCGKQTHKFGILAQPNSPNIPPRLTNKV